MTADILNVPRRQAKNINFASQYGAADNKLSSMAGISASFFRESMAVLYPGVVSFMDDTSALAQRRYREERHAYVHTLFGYRLSVPVGKWYVATNYVIQGTAGDIGKNAMIDCQRYIDENDLTKHLRIVLNVHDELVFEVHRSIPKHHMTHLRDIMASQGDKIGCPTPVEVSRTSTNWGNCHKARLPKVEGVTILK